MAVDGEVTATIGCGLVVFLGVRQEDQVHDAEWLARKIPHVRCFECPEGRMNRSVAVVQGEILVISQFTLYGILRKGTRPSFNRAASPSVAAPLYETFLRALETELGRPVGRGVFGAMMKIEVSNDGPVTLILDTHEKDF